MTVALSVLLTSLALWGLSILVRRLVWAYRVRRGQAVPEPTVRALTGSRRRNIVLGVVLAISVAIATWFAVESEAMMSRYAKSPEVSATLDAMAEVHRAADAQARATGVAPVAIAALVTDGRMASAFERDGCGTRLTYRVVGDRYTICSAGEDQRHGTDDDLCDTYPTPRRRASGPDRAQNQGDAEASATPAG